MKVVTAWTKESFGPDGLLGRENKSEDILQCYLIGALEKLNPGLPQLAYNQAAEQVSQKVADKTLGKSILKNTNLKKKGWLLVLPTKK